MKPIGRTDWKGAFGALLLLILQNRQFCVAPYRKFKAGAAHGSGRKRTQRATIAPFVETIWH
ncbi:hypothetical protein D1821_10660 [Phaeobacter inhibens]|nr:hypothetical protein D1821_10660 [Phaeobacter inhibens]